MKTLKISDDIHSKLTGLLGELTAQTNKMQTYQDAINALLKEAVMIPEELIIQTENFIQEQKQHGYTTKEEFIKEAIRFRIKELKNDNEFIEVSKEQYDELEEALKAMGSPYRSPEQFIRSQISEALNKYEEYRRTISK